MVVLVEVLLVEVVLALVEMPHHKESSICFGGGGGGAWSEKPVEKRLGVLRVEAALRTGAEVIATACPYCIRMLNEGVAALGVADRIVVLDLAEMLWESLETTETVDTAELVSVGLD